MSMTPTERSAKTPHRTGRLALLRALLPGQGTGAPATALAVAVALAGLLAFVASPALAFRGHVFERSFGSGPCTVTSLEPCEGKFDEPDALAVSEATGDVYIADKNNNRVEWFSATGAFVGQFNGSGTFPSEEGKKAPEPLSFIQGRGSVPSTIAVDNGCALQKPALTGPACEAFDPSNGDVYVPTGEYNHGAIDKFTSTGAFIGQIVVPLAPGQEYSGEIIGVAVDTHGALWVEHRSGASSFVDNFSNVVLNEYRGFRIPAVVPGEGEPEAGLEVDSADDFYISNTNSGLAEFNASGELLRGGGDKEFGPAPVHDGGVALESVTGGLYLELATSVRRVGPDGSEIESLAIPGGDGGALAVDFLTGRVYVIDENKDVVDVYELEPPAAPKVQSESVSDVTATGATFEAEINPRSEPFEASTTYRFEYITEVAYEENLAHSDEGFTGASSLPFPAGSLAPDYELNAVSARAVNLAPGTPYHYRVTAENGLGTTVTEERTFTTQGTGGPLVLPDGRAWEMVTPPDKFGAAILPIREYDPIQAAAAGSAIAYAATAPIEAHPAGNSIDPVALSLRGSAGWSSRSIALPHTEASTVGAVEHLEYPYFSADLSLGIAQPLRSFDSSLSTEASEQTAFLRSNYFNGNPEDPCASSCYKPLVTGAEGFANVPEGTEFGICEGQTCGRAGAGSAQCPPAFFCGPQFEAASPNLEHIVIHSRAALTEGSPGGLYEWSAGKLTYVGRGTVGNINLVSEAITPWHAVSADGSRIVIRGESGGLKGLLLRDTATEETVQLGGEEAIFGTASVDDSKVFFLSKTGGDLEECEIVEVEGKLHCDLSDLTPGAGVLAPIAGVSEDGSTVYFASNGVLAPGAVQGTVQAQVQSSAQQTNLYVRQNGVTKLVAILSGADAPDWGDDKGQADIGVKLPVLTARVSPDGRWLAFMSQRRLTGYDNQDASTGHLDEEVYLYHAPGNLGTQSGSLTCASCNPTGARPHGVAYKSLEGGPVAGESVWPIAASGATVETWLAASIPGWTTSRYQSRYLSNGGRLFFNSSDALVPQDTNNTEDVYEYEPPGVGSCTVSSSTFSPRSGGCVSLISSGTSPEESGFLDASENGDNVFFLTAAKLSGRDVDSSLDIYDAHVCSAESPCPPPPQAEPPACNGDACQAPASAPEDVTPGSLTFSGPGNLAPSPAEKKTAKKTVKCKRGFAKKKSKCVRKKSKKRAKRASRNRRGK